MKLDVQVITAVAAGKRPGRPSDELCMTRGLDDEMWGIIEACWTMKPTDRLKSGMVVKKLRDKPQRPADSRPPCDLYDAFTRSDLFRHSFLYPELDMNVSQGER